MFFIYRSKSKIFIAIIQFFLGFITIISKTRPLEKDVELGLMLIFRILRVSTNLVNRMYQEAYDV